MRKSFFTGLGILLPIVLTIVIVLFLVNLLTNPFLGIAEGILEYFGLFGKQQLLLITSRVLVLATLFIIILSIGFFGRWVITHYVLKMGDYIIHKIPVVNKVYKALKDVIQTVFDSESPKFSQVVLVRFPHSKGLALGFLVNEQLPANSDQEYQDMISVFVPATPNPTMGFNLLYHRDQLTFIDMKVEDALKCIVSCGVLFAENGHRFIGKEAP